MRNPLQNHAGPVRFSSGACSTSQARAGQASRCRPAGPSPPHRRAARRGAGPRHLPPSRRQPRAQLGHTFVAYEFKRAKRKNIGFVVGVEGLVVSAPRWVPLAEVDAAVQGKSAWILSKLEGARSGTTASSRRASSGRTAPRSRSWARR
jgi:hypothetical protein